MVSSPLGLQEFIHAVELTCLENKLGMEQPQKEDCTYLYNPLEGSVHGIQRLFRRRCEYSLPDAGDDVLS